MVDKLNKENPEEKTKAVPKKDEDEKERTDEEEESGHKETHEYIALGQEKETSANEYVNITQKH